MYGITICVCVCVFFFFREREGGNTPYARTQGELYIFNFEKFDLRVGLEPTTSLILCVCVCVWVCVFFCYSISV